MVSRTQVTLDSEMHHRARQRASELGVSLAEYFRQLICRDLARLGNKPDVSRIFDLGDSRGSDIARNKNELIAGVLALPRKRSR